jgi:pimeloyl-ACP methyl ester carboxylesterase
MNEAIDLVFLHGGQHGSWCWAALIESLRAQGSPVGRMLALDVPGCGHKRGRDTSHVSINSVAEELCADVRRAGLQHPVLIGHSMAGALLPAMALAAPGLYRELVFLSACVPREGDSVMSTMGTGLHGSDPRAVGYPVDPVTTPPLELLSALFGPDMDEASLAWVLAECVQDQWPMSVAVEPVHRPGYLGSVPVSYLVTLRDPILPPAWQGRFAERAGAERLYTLDTPHEPFITHPQVLARLLVAQVLR